MGRRKWDMVGGGLLKRAQGFQELTFFSRELYAEKKKKRKGHIHLGFSLMPPTPRILTKVRESGHQKGI